MIAIKKDELTNPIYLKEVGIEVLEESLGSIGAAMFLQLLSYGSGDYTSERKKYLEGQTIEDFEKDLEIIKSNKIND